MTNLWPGLLAAMLLLGGCSSESAPPDVVVPPIEPPDTSQDPIVNVREFGATANDETDDTQAFRAALAALPVTGGIVAVDSGTYLLTPVEDAPNRAIDLSDRRNVTIRGAGASLTTLKMAPGTYQGATHMIFVRKASDVTFEGFTLDGNRAQVVYRDEQSHGIQIVSSLNTRIREMTFQNMGGDGVRMFGAPQAGEPWTEGVWIENSRFQDTTRNGISIQRAARHIEIRDNTFERISDQSISSEPSGAGAPTDILVEGNLVKHSTAAYAIAMAGIRPRDVLMRMTFRNNRIENGAAYFLWTDSLLVQDNLIQGDRLHSPLRLHDVSAGIVTDNNISALGEAGTGAVQIVNHDNALPSSITLEGNTIQLSGGISGIHVRDALGDIEILRNTITGDDGIFGITFTTILASGVPRTGLKLIGNEIRNFAIGISFVTRGDAYREVEIRDNVLDHNQSPPAPTIGILFRKTGPYETFASILSNLYGAGIRTQIEVRNQ